MKKYYLEYSWNVDGHILMVVSSNINNEEELVIICDELYEKYKKLQNRLSFYFFNSRENAVDYVYRKFVLIDFTEKAMEKSHCVGYLEQNELYGFFSPRELIKVYNSQNKIDDSQSNVAFAHNFKHKPPWS